LTDQSQLVLTHTRKHRRKWPLRLALALVCFALLLMAFRADLFGPSSQESLDQARLALLKQEFAAAEKYALRIPDGHPLWHESRLVAGEAATRAKRLGDAIGHYLKIPRDDSEQSILAMFSLGEVYRELGHLSKAEDCYAYVLAKNPDDLPSHSQIAFLKGFSGRRWESLPHLWTLIDGGDISLDGLTFIGDFERPISQPEYLAMCRRNASDDVLVQLAHVTDLIVSGQLDEVKKILASAVQKKPEILSAQARLGEQLVGDDLEFLEWHRQLPENSDSHPDIWFVRGLFAKKHGELAVAARCSWEAVRIAPSHRRGNYQLGQVLTVLKKDSAKFFIDRGARLLALTSELNDVVKSDGRHEPSVRSSVGILESIGRVREASAWAEFAAKRFRHVSWPQETLIRLSQLSESPDRLPAQLDPTQARGLSGFPDHREFFSSLNPVATAKGLDASHARIQFQVEQNVGTDFVYYNGHDPSTKGGRMFEQGGGGIAVLDFDGDGWPDLYFSQGTSWKHGELSAENNDRYRDRLFRNVSGKAYVEVTGNAGIRCFDFGQGVTTGDFNEDGFPDLYVANIGGNRIFMNNGDGTFSDVTDSAGLKGKVWTASCMIADLNADGLSDLFDVNYLRGDGVFVRICEGKGCSPKNFDGEPDVVHINRGDGSFDSISIASMRGPGDSELKRDSGLGLLAADIFVRGRPSVFISNDQVANLFLKNVPADNPHNILFEDHGISSGLAFNEDGLAMACMGIAAADVNGDHRLDLFVTNFDEEANTLYLQDTNGLFFDATSQFGLEAPSMAYVGWGTQFLDADLDGDPDLVLVNGDVDDNRADGGKFGMKPQFFRNLGGKFEEVSHKEAGSFFDKERAGRGLARLDWNRDGRMEFVVSNIREPAVLATNQTSVGHFLNVELRATLTSRDAIGAVVEVQCEDRRWTSQLVAGDGYMASNQRVLQFGIGDAERVSSVKVTWPSGKVTVVEELPVDVTVRLVESSDSGTLWSGLAPGPIQVETRALAP
jgi:tetratricopeptide (TPR) repeat protein